MWIVLTRSHAFARVFLGSPRHGRPAPRPPPSSSPPLSLWVALVVPLRASGLRSFQLRHERLHLSPLAALVPLVVDLGRPPRKLLCAALVPDAADRAVRTAGGCFSSCGSFSADLSASARGTLRSSRCFESRPFHTLSRCCSAVSLCLFGESG